MSTDVNTPAFWQSTYDAGNSQWDLGTPAPVFVDLLAGPDAPPRGRLVVPGCGRGYDALRFARAGFDVLGIDFADTAVAAATAAAQRLKLSARFLQADLFDLPASLDSSFDLALEYTCFCAIDPSRRADYVRTIARLLKGGGELIALFYPLRDTAGGPPFSVNRDEIRALFAPHFEETAWLDQPPLSLHRRRDFEALARLRRR